MKFTLGTKPNNNGNIYRVEIDTENKIYKKGCSICSWNIDFYVTKEEINNFIKYELKTKGFKEVDTI